MPERTATLARSTDWRHHGDARRVDSGLGHSFRGRETGTVPAMLKVERKT
jgi:hypothetical protein